MQAGACASETFERRKMESHAANRTYYFYHSYYGTGLCLLEWCGGAVRDFQAKEIRAGGGRSSGLRPCDLGLYLI
jgi:hypothetical protein